MYTSINITFVLSKRKKNNIFLLYRERCSKFNKLPYFLPLSKFRAVYKDLVQEIKKLMRQKKRSGRRNIYNNQAFWSNHH